MTEFNHQEIFNKVYEGLRAQGFVQSFTRNANGHMECAYRGEDGRKCALGQLIPNEIDCSEFEGRGPHDDRVVIAMGFDASLGDPDRTFLQGLQTCHDNGNVEISPAGLDSKLQEFATKRFLTVPVSS